MSRKVSFNKKILATVIASTALTGLSGFAFAQDDSVEEVTVTGIRASMERAMDVKRESAGVVDAISSEDMGKFPDTNLAESLQRITGVSIDRQNGEGSKITVRGFGDQNNMVTLNGRTMPAAGVYGGGGTSGSSAGATRGFDFANLASESVSGVQVYKTGKANIATGGIGATVNIQTMKPLDAPGFKASVGGKAMNDSTNRTGDDVTPEVSGLVSWSNDTFGVGLTASHQERDSGSSSIWVNEWNISRWAANHNTNAVGQTENNKGLYRMRPNVNIINKPEVGQLYARPNDIRYIFSDVERVRDNAQLTLQWAPTDRIVTTLDYTFAENDIQERRGESTSWIDNGTSIDAITFDGNKNIASPLYIHETQGPRDHGYEQQLRNQTNTLNSVGFNAAFEANDSLTLTFDAHNSKMESLPTGPGGAGQISATIGTPTQISHGYDFSHDVPFFTEVNDDSRFRDTNENGVYDAGEVRVGNNNGIYDVGDVGSQIVRIYANNQTNEINEIKLGGSFKFDDNSHFDFGIERREMENINQQFQEKYMTMGDWGISAPGDIPASLLQDFDYAGMFDDFNTRDAFHGGFKGNAEDIAAYLADKYQSKATASNPYCVCINPVLGVNSVVEEDTDAAYFQLGLPGEFAGMPTNFLAGLRYETTDVSSSALVTPPAELTWLDNNDFTSKAGTVSMQFGTSTSYDHLLPSFDFDIALNDEIKARVSFGQTIARAGYGSLDPAVSGYSGGGGSTALGAIRRANAGNPSLLPLHSTNADVSVEWYYDDSSYVSAGVFEKRVKNFIGSSSADEQLFDIKDQTNAASPRVIAARAALQSNNIAVDDNSLFTMMVILDNPADFPDGAADYLTEGNTLAKQIAIATKYNLSVRADDPTATWSVNRPSNNREAKIYGAEFAAQHFFGDTGFGLQANYTIVRGDIGFDNYADPGEEQFALLGLSDTANLVAIYENDFLQARVAYNWRDEYLANANRGSARSPVYVEAYSQIDANISYNVTEALTLSLEGLNILGADTRSHGRSKSMLEEMYDLGPRYTIGARYNF